MMYLNPDGNPEITGIGYAIIKRTFYEDDDDENSGRIKNEFYYDADGSSIVLSNGQFGQDETYPKYFMI